MYIITNAIKNIFKNKGRYLIVALTIIAMIAGVAVSMFINSTADNIVNDYKNRFGTNVIIYANEKEIQNQNKYPEELTKEDYLKYSESQYVKDYTIEASYQFVLDSLKAVDEEYNQEFENWLNSGDMIISGDGSDTNSSTRVTGTMILKGMIDVNSNSEFASNNRKIIEGKAFNGLNECIISEKLAQKNNLSVNDYIDISYAKNTIQKLKLKVVGIYEDKTTEYSDTFGQFKSSLFNRRNEVITSFDTLTASLDVKGSDMKVSYQITSPDDLKSFEKELRSKGLSTLYSVSADTENYERIVGPVMNMTRISSTFMWVFLALGMLILSFVSFIAIRERKYEIGVLRAMGMKKAKVASMLVLETIIITFVCLLIGIGIGSAVAQPISDNLLTKQVETYNSIEENGGQISGSTETESESQIQQMKVELSADSVVKVSLVAFFITIMTSAMGVVMITKCEPIKILQNRN